MVVGSPTSKRNRSSLVPTPEGEGAQEMKDSPSGRATPGWVEMSPTAKSNDNLPSSVRKSTGKKKQGRKSIAFEADSADDQAVLQQKWTYEAHNILVNRQCKSTSDKHTPVIPISSTPQISSAASSSSIRKSIFGILSTPLPSIPTIPSSMLKTPLKVKRNRQLSLVKFIFFLIIIVLVEQKFQSYFGYNRSTKKTREPTTQVAPKKINYDTLLRTLENRVDYVMDKVQTYSLKGLCSRETTSITAEDNIIEISKDLEKFDRELDNMNRTLQVAKNKAISFEKSDVNYMVEIKNIKSILNHITEGMHATDKVLSDTTELLVSLRK